MGLGKDVVGICSVGTVGRGRVCIQLRPEAREKRPQPHRALGETAFSPEGQWQRKRGVWGAVFGRLWEGG